MELVLLHIEITLLSALFVGLYALKPRFGLVPLYAASGLTFAFVMLGHRLDVNVPVLAGSEISYTSLTHFSLLLVTLVLVYTLEGTREAQRFIAGLGVLSVLLYLFRWLLALHIAPLDVTLYGRDHWLEPGFWSSFVSTIAYVVDGLALIVVYQALHNLYARIPKVFSVTLALVAAMVVDALVYGGLSGKFDLAAIAGHFTGKLSAGLAAAIPVSLYIAYQLRSVSEQVRDDVLERSAFEIMDLRRELKNIRAALTESREEYQAVRSLFSRYVVPDVVDEILKDTSQVKLGGDLKEVTILFSDIRGYSTLSEFMNPEQTIDLLNEYFGAMGEVISEERGAIIEFEGDAILTVFGAPLDQADHAARAVRVATGMLERLESLNRRWNDNGTARHWQELNIDSFRIRIGVHTGPVVVGNVGSESRTKYAVIGDTVNTAARVETLNKKLRTTLLLSSTTVEQADAGLQLEPIDLGTHRVKGRAEPVHVFTLRGLPNDDTSFSS